MLAGGSLCRRLTPRSGLGAAGGTRPSEMTGCGQRPREQSALPMRRKSTCLRMTSSGSAGLTGAGGRTARSVRPAGAGGCASSGSGAEDTTLAPMCHPNGATFTPIPPSRDQPCRIQLSRGSAPGSGWRCWQSHQVPPGHFSWCCCRQDKQIMSPLSTRHGHGGSGGPGRQAALARRIRRRRSADRSSSFRPPQVPYFSGRLTA